MRVWQFPKKTKHSGNRICVSICIAIHIFRCQSVTEKYLIKLVTENIPSNSSPRNPIACLRQLCRMTLRYQVSRIESGNEQKPKPQPKPEPQPIDTGTIVAKLSLKQVTDNTQDMANKRQGSWLGAISIPCLRKPFDALALQRYRSLIGENR